MRDLLHFVLLGDGADQRPGHPHGDGSSGVVLCRITSIDSRAMVDHGSILGKYVKFLQA